MHLTSYINLEKLQYYRGKISEVERLLNGYISYLKKNPD